MGQAGGPRVEIPPREAHGSFYGGEIEVEALLARAGTHWARGDEGEKEGAKGGRRGGEGGFHGGLGMGGGGGHMRGGFGGREREGGEAGEGGERGGYGGGGGEEGPRPPPMRASNQMPILLRLRLTNHGQAPVAVEVTDFNSVLGDFVVQPDKIDLKPGQSVEAEPMVSRLGIPEGDVPLTVKLSLAGKEEQQVLTLHKVEKPAPATVPPASPAPANPATAP